MEPKRGRAQRSFNPGDEWRAARDLFLVRHRLLGLGLSSSSFLAAVLSRHNQNSNGSIKETAP